MAAGMDSYLKMASKINMGSMSHTSLVNYIKIWESTNSADPIEVPLERNGTLLLSTLIGQFPNTAGLRFWSDTGAWRGLKCEDNVIYPPPQGWGTLDYYIVSGPPNLKRTSAEADGPTSKSQKTDVEMAATEEAEKEMAEEMIDDDEAPAIKVEDDEKEEKVPELIISALPYSMTEEELKDHFKQFGEVVSCQIMKNRRGASRGFAFFTFKTVEETNKARAGVHIFNGRRYYIQIANKSKGMNGENERSNHVRVKLFVGHIPAEADESDLREHFGKYGVLKDVYIPKPNKGYGFVEFGSREVAERVLEDTHVMMSTFLNVNYPQTQKQNDVKREMEKMQENGMGNGKPGILGYYGFGNNMQGGYNNWGGGYGGGYGGPYGGNYGGNHGNGFNHNNKRNNNNNYNNNKNNNNRNNAISSAMPKAPWES